MEEIRPLAKEGQHFTGDFSTDGKTFVSDKRLLKNILINLLSNAVKFSPEGATIRVDATLADNNTLHLAVQDRGIGISQEDQQHLFSSFFRGANALNIEGTGLGLHIVRRYLDLLHGSIRLQSALNEGTTVTIEVPERPPSINDTK
ncbi:sensor histidine kinase [Puia sp. P3]|uniref:sensor histidine kinase n=1 Tax=Puia sp. P3 TaxID=3423952 RepID=UPI003D67C37F